LGEKNLFNAQRCELIRRFDLNKESWLADEICLRFNQLMDEDEAGDGIERLKPGELLISFQGKRVVIPLLSAEVISILQRSGSFSRAKATVEKMALKAIKRVAPGATMEELRAIISPRDRLPHTGDGDRKKAALPRYLAGPLAPPQMVNARTVDRPAGDDVLVPQAVVDKMLAFLVQEEHISRARALAMIFRLAYLRELYCPPLSRVRPGQVAWIGISTTDRQQREHQTAYREQVPLLLTLHTQEELKRLARVKSLSELEAIQQAQMARVLTEAYLHGGLLALVDLQQLFLRSHQTFSRLLRQFMVDHQMVLPTPGTILDAGSAMTHKDIIIGFYLKGYFSHDIARITRHSPEAVDRYIDDFERVLILHTYGLPLELMARVVKRGPTLVAEYLNIIAEHFPDREAVKSHLRLKGVKI
jgi:hypothetical protein